MTAQLIDKCPAFLPKGNNKHLSPGVCEMEAEAVDFAVARHFGLDGVDILNYFALHGSVSGAILEHLERIRATVAEIIEAVELASLFAE